MPALGELLTSSTLTPVLGKHQLWVTSDGYQHVLVGTTVYSRSGAAGTWASTLTTPVTMGSATTINSVFQNGDSLSFFVFPVTSAVLNCHTYAWNTTTHAYGSTASGSINLNAVDASVSRWHDFDVRWNSTYSFWYAVAADDSGLWYAFSFDSAFTAVAHAASLPHISHPPSVVRLMAPAMSSATMIALELAPGIALCTVTPGTGGTVTVGPGELTAPASTNVADAAFDASGNLDIVYIQSPSDGHLFTYKRTGLNTFSSIITIASPPCAQPTLCYRTATDDLWVFFESTAAQPNGEIWVVKRTGGVWGGAFMVIGGDGAGYSLPNVAALTDGTTYHLLYGVGTTSTKSWYHDGIGAAATPNPPSGITPSGLIGTLTPTIGWTYANPVATDIQSAYEIKVINTGTSATVWDSGKVTSAGTSVTYGTGSNTGDANYIAPVTLVYGTQYQVQVRTWDTGLNSVSSFSTAVNFTAFQAPTATITQVVAAGTTSGSSPATIASPLFTTSVSYSQAQSHGATGFTQTLYASDGVSVIATTSGTLTLASGSSAALPAWTPSGIHNSTTYKLAVSLTDGTTGVAGISAQWTLTTAYTPPSPPTGLAVTVDNDNGLVTANWTNVGGPTSVTVYARPNGTTAWNVITSGSLRTSVVIFPPIGIAYDYAVTSMNATGVESAMTTQPNVPLLYKYGRYGVWLNDVTAPGVRNIALGLVDAWDSASKLHHNEDVLRFVPDGRSKPITSYGLADWWSASGRTYDVPVADAGATGTTSASTILAQFGGILTSHNPLLYRDPDGAYKYVLIENFDRSTIDITMKQVVFDLFETDYTPAAALLAV
jgi:hypothetical protein